MAPLLGRERRPIHTLAGPLIRTAPVPLLARPGAVLGDTE